MTAPAPGYDLAAALVREGTLPVEGRAHDDVGVGIDLADAGGGFVDLVKGEVLAAGDLLAATSGSVSWALTRLCNCSIARPPGRRRIAEAQRRVIAVLPLPHPAIEPSDGAH
jgi:hypothetical protein